MKNYITLLFVSLLLTSTSVTGQQWRASRIEAYGGTTVLQYFGDIGGTPAESNLLGLRDIELKSIRPGVTIGARYQIDRQFRVRGNLAAGLITKSDIGSRNENRNYAFNTLLIEFSALAEYYLIPESDRMSFHSIMQIRDGVRGYGQPWALYITAGLGGLYFDVTPKDDLVTSERFEGDHSTTVIIPFGMGLKYTFMPRTSIGLEVIGRYAFSNYLDGFSPDAGRFNDVYYSGNIKINYKFSNTPRRGGKRSLRSLF